MRINNSYQLSVLAGQNIGRRYSSPPAQSRPGDSTNKAVREGEHRNEEAQLFGQLFEQPTSAFVNSAQELFNSMAQGLEDLKAFTYESINPSNFARSFSSPGTEMHQIDLKRHQNYFNQMMNFDTPSGSWIDIKA